MKVEHEILSNAETKLLIEQAQNGSEEAEARLVECNQRLVWSVVQKVKGNGEDLDDLYQSGAIGLVKCIRHFDLSMGFKFATYAVPKIYGEIQRYLRDDANILQVSRRTKELANLIIKHGLSHETTETIREYLGLEDSDNAIASAVDYITHGQHLTYFDAPIELRDGTVDLYDMIPSKNSISTFMLELGESFSRCLTDEEQFVLNMRYFADFTQKEIGEMLGVNQVQVSRRELRALQKLQAFFGVKDAPTGKKLKGDREKALAYLREGKLSMWKITQLTHVPRSSLLKMSEEIKEKVTQTA